jgi:hypothetical protein
MTKRASKPAKMDAEFAKQATDIMTHYGECMTNAMSPDATGSGSATP